MSKSETKRGRGIAPALLLATGLAVIAGLAASCSPRLTFHPEINKELIRLAYLDEGEIPSVLRNLEREDAIGDWYRDPRTSEATLDFFSVLTGSREIALAVLENAERCALAPSLAFALAFEESGFKPEAYNKNEDSIDRGLFQLNSKSFPSLGTADFYDPAVNARLGMQHLRFCLDSAGNEVAALAMYNAGRSRVSKGGTPRRTLDYIWRIQKYEENIASLFVARVVAGGAQRAASARLPLPSAD
jgi:hypothetical protein